MIALTVPQFLQKTRGCVLPSLIKKLWLPERFSLLAERILWLPEQFPLLAERFVSIAERFYSLAERISSSPERFSSLAEQFIWPPERFFLTKIQIKNYPPFIHG